jgi:hypothetical protein
LIEIHYRFTGTFLVWQSRSARGPLNPPTAL